jgi:ligand-binding SRPBCC domain-containing protein
MPIHQLQREQLLPWPVERVFAFFADAGNLEAITPPWMGFRIVTPPPIELRAGAVIEYRLRWRGLPMRWISEIAIWEPPLRFVDVQSCGPYKSWRHTHEFLEAADGTLMRDDVRYAMPWGPFGAIAHRWIVRRNLEAIFDYRAQRVVELLAG